MKINHLWLITICIGSFLFSACSNSEQRTKEELIREFSSPERQSIIPLNVGVVPICNTAKKSSPFVYQIANVDTSQILCSIKGYNFDSNTVNPSKPDFSVLGVTIYPSTLFEGTTNHAPKNGVVLVVSCTEEGMQENQVGRTFYVVESVACTKKDLNK